MCDSNRLLQLALHCIPGIGSVTIRQLISHFDSPAEIWNAGRKKLTAIRGIGPFTYDLLRNRDQYLQEARRRSSEAAKSNTVIVFHTDPEFPSRLRHIPDAPSLLYFRGNANLNAERIVAVVGTRSSTEYGQIFTDKLIDELKIFNTLIISGLAYGIDIGAHRAALRNTLPTVAVMAGGTDWIYPAIHRSETNRMISCGGIISEHAPGTKPEAHNFPARNRIIAGMSDAVVVVEAGHKGGAQITARLANDYNREVFALPGNVRSYASAGCHNLIKSNQAHLLTSAGDIARIMNWDSDGEAPKKTQPENLTVAERRILAVLNDFAEGLPIDRLTWAANLTISEAAVALVNLECRLLIRSLPGNVYATR